MRASFRMIALLEALSWFALLGTMYLKYAHNMPDPNKVIGMAHGIFFLVYVLLATMISDDLKWTKRDLTIALIASLIPGATIYVERRMMGDEEK